MDINLDVFTGSHDCRAWINTPFKIKNHSYATDGHCAVRVELQKEHQDCTSDYPKGVVNIFKGVESFTYQELTDFKKPEMKKCATCRGHKKAYKATCFECDGEAFVTLENDHNVYSVECQSCDGDGEIIHRGGEIDCCDCKGTGEVTEKQWDAREIFNSGVHINASLVIKYLDLPNVKFSPDKVGDRLFVKFDGGYGVIMGMRV